MKTSTEIHSAAKIIGEEKAVEYIAKAGFEAWDFSMFTMARYDYKAKVLLESNHPLAGKDYLKFARRLKQIGLDNGIECNQAHAPFPSYSKDVRSYYNRAIECVAEAGGKIIVIHPDNYKNAEENAEMYFELLPFAKEHGVKIATENMWNWNDELNQAAPAACSSPESFVAHIDAVNDEYFTACLDIGHAEMAGLNTNAPEMIRALGQRLGALHVHDNNLHDDSHQIPFSMQINFEEMIKALREVNYQGDMTLECDAYLGAYKESEERVFEGIKNLADSAKRLVEMFKA
ncbi:MAG: sugar phosphate isomerase/epimerase [Clostridia bacterium]|nr:sugar phosphate isomerase/epimerase [Clostridia bacterium]